MLRVFLIAGVLSVSAGAQDEVASQESKATFNSRVNLVMVPVVVRDKQGHEIGTLKKEDFQLFDRGKPQLITRFSMEKASDRIKPIEIPAEDAAALKTDAPATATSKGSVLPARFIAYVFDDLHTQFGDLAQARNAAQKHLVEALRQDERVAIYTTSGLVMLDFTDDLGKIGEALLKLQPRSMQTGAGDCPPMSYYEADLIFTKNDASAMQVAITDTYQCANLTPPITGPTGTTASPDQQAASAMVQAAVSRAIAIGSQESRVTLTVLKDIARRMASAPGERTMVLVSAGFFLQDVDRRDETDLLDRAIRSKVTISTLDARGLYVEIMGGDASVSTSNRSNSPTNLALRSAFEHEEVLANSDILAELAAGTGGVLFNNNNDLNEGFTRTTRAPEFIYMLGFSPQNLKLDGSYHALKVSLAAKGYSMVARRGYYAPRHAADEAELAKDEIREALFSRDEMQDIPLQLQTQFFKTADQKARISLVTKIDLKPLHYKKDEGREKNTLVVVAGIFDRNGNLVTAVQKSIEMRLKDENFDRYMNAGIIVKTSLDVTPGNYVIRVVLRDQEGRLMTARNRVVEIPY